MTELLKKAFNEASRLRKGDQDMIGKWMLAELAAEKRWEQTFARTQDSLAKLGRRALNEHRKGRSKPLDPEAL
ncbi:MAG: hypothetical protein QOG61_1192 [Candidatus Binataceae bacterium]|jgi:hypothetical protein|nr:hypothetical protein [Candidatus Binataceae bacterium]MEA2678632.1 hypothetical protein [Candidatus Binataceae bacterium]